MTSPSLLGEQVAAFQDLAEDERKIRAVAIPSRIYTAGFQLVALGLASYLFNYSALAQSAGPFQPGLVLKSVQRCSQYPGDGVTLTVRTISERGTAGTVGVRINCWGATHMLDDASFIGSLRTEGSTISLTFFGNRTGRVADNASTMTGVWATENGKPVLTFGQSTFRGAKDYTSKELIFRTQ